MDALAIRIAHDYPKSAEQGLGTCHRRVQRRTLVGQDLRKSLYVRWLACCRDGAPDRLRESGEPDPGEEHSASGKWPSARRSARAAAGWKAPGSSPSASVAHGRAAGALGLLLAYAGLALMKATMPDGTIPANLQVVMDGRVLFFVVVLSVVTASFSGRSCPASQGDPPRPDPFDQAGWDRFQSRPLEQALPRIPGGGRGGAGLCPAGGRRAPHPQLLQMQTVETGPHLDQRGHRRPAHLGPGASTRPRNSSSPCTRSPTRFPRWCPASGMSRLTRRCCCWKDGATACRSRSWGQKPLDAANRPGQAFQDGFFLFPDAGNPPDPGKAPNRARRQGRRSRPR